MWPYTDCEWNFITRTVKRSSKTEKAKLLIVASILPSIILASAALMFI